MYKFVKYLIWTSFMTMALGNSALAAEETKMYTTDQTIVYDTNLNIILPEKNCPDQLAVKVTGTTTIGDKGYYIVDLDAGFMTVVPFEMLTSQRTAVTIEDMVNADPAYINNLVKQEMVEFEFDKAGGSESYSFNGNTVVLKCYYTDVLLKAYGTSAEEMQRILKANVKNNIQAITQTADRIYQGYGIYPETVTEIDYLGDIVLCTTYKNFVTDVKRVY